MRKRERDLMELFMAVLVLRAHVRRQSLDPRLKAFKAVNVINQHLGQTFHLREAAQAASYTYQHIEKEMERLL
jgi:creatinine amidohydrolase/Fe(II)-dependent formamide hydrolase-like protein